MTMSGSISDLIQALGSADPARRGRAAEGLARLGESASGAAVPLVAATGDSVESVREWAATALEGAGPPDGADVARLADLLSDDQGNVGYWAATLLGRLQDAAAGAVPQLAEAVATHPRAGVRERAAWALERIGVAAAAAEPALDSASRSENPRLARLAHRALKQIRR